MDQSLLPLTPGIFSLVLAPHAGTQLVAEVAARLAIAGSVRLIDCGNRCNIYPIAKVIRRLTTNVNESLSHVLISRAFTTYQVMAMLQRVDATYPTFILDLLSTFLDESITLTESHRLLDLSIAEIKRLSQVVPVLVTVKPLLSISTERVSLLEALMQATTSIYRLESPEPLSAQIQPSLF